MKVLLLKNVVNIWKEWEIVNVKEWFASNMLFPKWLAKRVSDADIKKLEEKSKQEESKRVELIERKHEIIEELRGQEFSFKIKWNWKGKIHGHVWEKEIISAIKRKFGYELTKKNIEFWKEWHIKKAEKRDVFIKMNWEIVSKISVEVIEVIA